MKNMSIPRFDLIFISFSVGLFLCALFFPQVSFGATLYESTSVGGTILMSYNGGNGNTIFAPSATTTANFVTTASPNFYTSTDVVTTIRFQTYDVCAQDFNNVSVFTSPWVNPYVYTATAFATTTVGTDVFCDYTVNIPASTGFGGISYYPPSGAGTSTVLMTSLGQTYDGNNIWKQAGSPAIKLCSGGSCSGGFTPPIIQSVSIDYPVSTSTPIVDFNNYSLTAQNSLGDWTWAEVFTSASSTQLTACASYYQAMYGSGCPGVHTYGTTFMATSSQTLSVAHNKNGAGTFYARAELVDLNNVTFATSSVVSYVVSAPVVGYTYTDPAGGLHYTSVGASSTATTTTDFTGGYTGYVPASCNWSDIGCNLVNVGGFLFMPGYDSVNKLGSLRYEFNDRYPFNYLVPVINEVSNLVVASSTQMVTYEMNLHNLGVGTSTPMSGLLPNFTFLSASTVKQYWGNSGLFEAFRALASAVLWLMFIQYLFFQVRNFFKSS